MGPTWIFHWADLRASSWPYGTCRRGVERNWLPPYGGASPAGDRVGGRGARRGSHEGFHRPAPVGAEPVRGACLQHLARVGRVDDRIGRAVETGRAHTTAAANARARSRASTAWNRNVPRSASDVIAPAQAAGGRGPRGEPHGHPLLRLPGLR